MIDREGRDRLAVALKQLLEGDISTDTFHLLNLGSEQDRAIYDIWLFGDTLSHGLYPYRMIGKKQPKPEIRQIAERCVLFLNSDLEYEWPSFPITISFYWLLILGALLFFLSLIL